MLKHTSLKRDKNNESEEKNKARQFQIEKKICETLSFDFYVHEQINLMPFHMQ